MHDAPAMSPRQPAARRAVVLGPQRHVPMVRPAVQSLCGNDASVPVALVSAGWEEREPEDGELREHLLRPILNLEIWNRVERIFERDTELFAAIRQRQDTLRRVQELYRLRLEGLMPAAAELLRRTGDGVLLDPERAEAVAMLQTLDREHMARAAAVHAEFQQQWQPQHRDTVVQHRRELEALLGGAACLCIAGGHVAVLLHRLRLFDLLQLWGDRPIVAWSAGAMVLSDRVVLFHRNHGQGGADTEVMEAGLRILPGIVPLPHARRRLDMRDRAALQLLARRFAPDACVVLDDGHRIDWNGSHWSEHAGTRTLSIDGTLQPEAL
jgi:Peptidase family S51